MNAFSVSVTRHTAQNASVHQRKPEVTWQNGQTITALFESVHNGTATLRAEGDVLFTADTSAIRGQVGDTLTFSVRRTQQGFELTQVDDRPAVVPPRGRATSMDAIKDFTQTMDSIKENNEYRIEHSEEEAKKIARAVAAVRRSQQYIAATGGKSAAAAIVESGLDLSKVSFAALENVMRHAKRAPAREMTDDDKAAGLAQKFSRYENAEAILSGLHQHGLPMHQRNISHMENAWEKLPAKMPEPSVEYLVADDAELTLDHVYKSQYAAPADYEAAKKKAAIDEIPAPPPWESARPAIERLFTQEDIPHEPGNFRAARFLLARDLPITKTNIERVLFLQDLPERVKDENFRDAFFHRAAEFISQDKPLGTLSLPEIVRMAEVQLKMAVQAASRHQHLSIDTDAMKENLKRLTALEAESYLKMAGHTDNTPQHISISASRLTSLFDTLSTLQPLTANVHAHIIHGTAPFTIEGVHQSVLAARAQQGYEQNATVPSARYGDSFAQVQSQFAPLLENMGIAATAESVKAAFILSKNQMDVNADNLQAVKEIDAKITAIANKLHPLIAAHMIKEGLNPLETHADQMLAYIKQFNLDMGESGSEKIARYIREMDENQAIDGSTRKTMIAVYRMLHVIQKDGAAALGLAAQLNTPLTLGDLLDLSQNRAAQKRGKNVNVVVDDQFGALERLTRPEGNIRQTIESGIARHISHMDIVADTFTNIAPPAALEKLIQAGGLAQALEDLAAEQKPPSPADISTAIEQLQAFISANPETVYKLQNRNISARTGHIKAADELEDSPRALEDALEEVLEEAGDEHELASAIPASDLSPLLAGQSPGQILAHILEALGDSERISPLKSLLAITHGLNGSAEEGFQLPVLINGRVSHLHMYVLNDRPLAADGAKVLLSLDTARLGTVSAYFTLNAESGLDAVISAETRTALDALESRQAELQTLAEQAGININALRFTLSEGVQIYE